MMRALLAERIREDQDLPEVKSALRNMKVDGNRDEVMEVEVETVTTL